jgi:UDP-GlcNAc:undecaprenyl-phosphate GlcNAc-1-phosphate transferase
VRLGPQTFSISNDCYVLLFIASKETGTDMHTLIFLGCVSFGLSLLLTPFTRDLFRRWGVMDQPDTLRKHHERAIPHAGGVAIAIAFVFSFILLSFFDLRGGNVVQDGLPFALRLMPAALLIFGVGLCDDIFGLKPWHKLAGEVVAACAAYWAGVHVSGFGGYVFPSWWSLPLTIGWLVLCTNAVNLIDGVDGLAAGVGLFATSTMLLAALLQDNFPLAIATVPLVGCLLGFLRYNFNPATVFLGDSGSLFVGFLLGCYGVLWSQKSATILGMTAPLMALSIPLIDTGLAIVRRFLRRQPIFSADRGHIHHRLLDQGMTARKVSLILYALCGLAAVFSLFMASEQYEGLIIVVFCATAWIGVQHLGYVEFGVAGRMFLEGAFRRQLSSQIALEHHEKRLNAAATLEDCWIVIEAASRDLGFEHVHLSIAGKEFYYGTAASDGWEISIPLQERDSLRLWRSFAEKNHTAIIAPYCEMIRTTLATKSFLPESQEKAYATSFGAQA